MAGGVGVQVEGVFAALGERDLGGIRVGLAGDRHDGDILLAARAGQGAGETDVAGGGVGADLNFDDGFLAGAEYRRIKTEKEKDVEPPAA